MARLGEVDHFGWWGTRSFGADDGEDGGGDPGQVVTFEGSYHDPGCEWWQFGGSIRDQIAVEAHVVSILSLLGFSSTARTRLGLAKVATVSKSDELLKQAKRPERVTDCRHIRGLCDP